MGHRDLCWAPTLAMLLWVVVEIIIVLSDPWTGKNRNRSSAVFRRLPIVVKYGSRAAPLRLRREHLLLQQVQRFRALGSET